MPIGKYNCTKGGELSASLSKACSTKVPLALSTSSGQMSELVSGKYMSSEQKCCNIERTILTIRGVSKDSTGKGLASVP